MRQLRKKYAKWGWSGAPVIVAFNSTFFFLHLFVSRLWAHKQKTRSFFCLRRHIFSNSPMPQKNPPSHSEHNSERNFILFWKKNGSFCFLTHDSDLGASGIVFQNPLQQWRGWGRENSNIFFIGCEMKCTSLCAHICYLCCCQCKRVVESAPYIGQTLGKKKTHLFTNDGVVYTLTPIPVRFRFYWPGGAGVCGFFYFYFFFFVQRLFDCFSMGFDNPQGVFIPAPFQQRHHFSLFLGTLSREGFVFQLYLFS